MASVQNVVKFSDYVSKAYEQNVKTPRPKKTLLREPKGIGERGREPMYLYALQTGPFVKIGISADVVRRADDMDALNPYDPIILLYRTLTRNTAQLIEGRIHDLLVEHHHKREWFRLPPLPYLRSTIKRAIAEGLMVERQELVLEAAIERGWQRVRALGITDRDQAHKVVTEEYRATKKAIRAKYEW